MKTKRLMSLLLSMVMLVMTCVPMNVFAEGEIVEEIIEEIIVEAAEPAEEPKEEASEEPAEEPVAASLEEPETEVIEEPVEEPETEVTEEPVEEPETEVTEEPVEEPETEVTEEPVEEPETEVTEEPIEEPETEVTEKPVEEPETEVTEEPVEEPETEVTEKPVEEPETEVTEEPSEEEFVPGYVMYEADTEIYENDSLKGEFVVLAEDSVVYAFEEAGEDVYAVYYVVEADEIEVGYIDGEGEMLTEEEVEDYLEEIAEDEEAVFAEIPDVDDCVLSVIELVVEEPEVEEPEVESGEIEIVVPDVESGAGEIVGEVQSTVIVVQPEPQSAVMGSIAVFSVEATGEGLTYQWQHKTSATGAWNTTKSLNSESVDTAKTNVLELEAKASRNGYIYRCRIKDASGKLTYTQEVALNVTNPPASTEIVKQPVDVTAVMGSTAVFSVEAIGDGLTYQWQHKTSETGAWNTTKSLNGESVDTAKTNVLELEAKASRNGYIYRCRIKDASGKLIYTNEVVLTIGSPIEIVKQPEAVTAVVGSTAVFSVEAIGDGLTYQWQHKTSETGAWNTTKSLNGESMDTAKTNVLELEAKASRNGYIYRCRIKDASGNMTYSNEVALNVTNPPASTEIVKQPKAVTAEKNSIAVFSVEATGEGLSYQWQHKTSETGAWNNTKSLNSESVDTAKTDTLYLEAWNSRNGYIYRCRIKDASGKLIYTDEVALTVVPPFEIVEQPKAVTAEKNSIAVFSVEATGVGLTYQWQHKVPGASGWNTTKSLNSESVDTAKTDTLHLEAWNSRNGYIYRCRIKDANGVLLYTDEVVLTVTDIPFEIVKQPEAVTAVMGSTAVFSVEATGMGLTYQWQHKVPGASAWNTTTGLATEDSANSAKTDTLHIEAKSSRDGYIYRCRIKNASGEIIYTDEVVLTLAPSLEIVKQPEAVTAVMGSTAVFSVEAIGDGLTYQWQHKVPGASGWNTTKSLNSESVDTAKTDTLELEAKASRNGYIYRCRIKDASGNMIYTDEVVLTIGEMPVIQTQPTDVTAAADMEVYFNVAATCKQALSYQWQYKANAEAEEWLDVEGAVADEYSVMTAPEMDGYIYRVVVTSEYGFAVISDEAVLNIGQIPEIVAGPENVEVVEGEIIVLTVEAVGEGLTYQWMYKTSEEEEGFNHIEGATEATYEFEATVDMDGYIFYVRVENVIGFQMSEGAVLTVNVPMEIVAQPQNVEVTEGETAAFSVEVIGQDLTYQWKYKVNAESEEWIYIEGANEAVYEVEATVDMNGYIFCVDIEDRISITSSDEATLTVNALITDIVVDEVTYAINGEGTVEVKSYAGSASSVTIPEMVEGYTVTAIGESAFEGNTALVSIDLPDTIEVIGKRAFKNCTNLANMD